MTLGSISSDQLDDTLSSRKSTRSTALSSTSSFKEQKRDRPKTMRSVSCTVANHREDMMREIAKKKEKKKRDLQLVIMLLLVSFAVLFLTSPHYVHYIIRVHVLDYYFEYPNKLATFMLTYNIVNKLYFTNNAINFFLYCISGTKFRQELKQVFCFWRKKK